MLPRVLTNPWDLILNSNYLFVLGGKVKDLGEEERMLPIMLLINSPMGPEDAMIVLGDIKCFCNIVSSIWSVERKTY